MRAGSRAISRSAEASRSALTAASLHRKPRLARGRGIPKRLRKAPNPSTGRRAPSPSLTRGSSSTCSTRESRAFARRARLRTRCHVRRQDETRKPCFHAQNMPSYHHQNLAGFDGWGGKATAKDRSSCSRMRVKMARAKTTPRRHVRHGPCPRTSNADMPRDTHEPPMAPRPAQVATGHVPCPAQPPRPRLDGTPRDACLHLTRHQTSEAALRVQSRFIRGHRNRQHQGATPTSPPRPLDPFTLYR